MQDGFVVVAVVVIVVVENVFGKIPGILFLSDVLFHCIKTKEYQSSNGMIAGSGVPSHRFIFFLKEKVS